MEQAYKKTVDIVILWIDGSDPEWLEEKQKYSPQPDDYSSAPNRFRNWDNFIREGQTVFTKTAGSQQSTHRYGCL